MSSYRIVDCNLHDLYEVAILRRRRLLLNWLDEGGLPHLEIVLPTNLETVPEGEFLLGTGSCRQELRIRLDRIVHARDPITGEDFAKS